MEDKLLHQQRSIIYVFSHRCLRAWWWVQMTNKDLLTKAILPPLEKHFTHNYYLGFVFAEVNIAF